MLQIEAVTGFWAATGVGGPSTAHPHSLARSATTVCLAISLLAGLTPPSLAKGADDGPGGEIYTCIDDKGRRLTADRPIRECQEIDQRILNRDGSLKAIRPPPPTADERAAKELRDREAAVRAEALAELARRDRNLLIRYKDEAAHKAARESALEGVRQAMETTQVRLAQLKRERRPLEDEAAPYKGKTVPDKLRTQLDANEMAAAAQLEVALARKADSDRINRRFDLELERLRKLWGGAAPGSLGPLETTAGSNADASGSGRKP